MLFTRADSSRYQERHMSLSKVKAYIPILPSSNTKCQDFMCLTVTQTKDFRCRQQCAILQCSYSSFTGLLLCSLAIIPSSLPIGKFSHLGCGAEGSRVRPEQGGGQDRTGERGTKACPCMGRHLTGMAEASSVVLSLCVASYQWGHENSQIQGT